MRYTEADRLSSNVEDRRHDRVGIAERILSEVYDHFRDLSPIRPFQRKPSEPKPEAKPKDQSTLGVGAEGLGSEIQLPEQKLDIGQSWLDEQIAKSKRPPEQASGPSPNDNPRSPENTTKTDSSSSESRFPPVFDNRPQGLPPMDSNNHAAPQHLEMTSPY